jgi:exodeoxyribonuclease V alpha subunit
MHNELKLFKTLLELQQQNIIRPVDYHLAVLSYKLSKSELFALVTCLVSNALDRGDCCWRWQATTSQILFKDEAVSSQILSCINEEKSQWLTSLKNNELVGDGSKTSMLVINKQNIFLYRYWNYEQQISNWLLQNNSITTDTNTLTTLLDDLFPKQNDNLIDWQKVAAANACLNKFTLITGGPGTGKTTTVAKILLLLSQLNNDKKLTVVLAAPTGKAATRMDETIVNLKQQLENNSSNVNIYPATTIHKLLKFTNKISIPRKNSNNKLVADIIIIDEASMVDVELMAYLVDALPKKIRLIFLGDHYQLPSVAPGNLIADICSKADGFSNKQQQLLATVTGENISANNTAQSALADSVIELQHSYRFKDNSSIGKLAKSIKQTNSKTMLRCLSEVDSQLCWYNFTSIELQQQAINLALTIYVNYFKKITTTSTPQDILNEFNKFRILCAIKDSHYGTKELNSKIESTLIKHNIIPMYNKYKFGKYYFGRPIILNRNDYHFGLSNGDTGVILPVANKLQATFINSENNIVYVPISQLTEHEPAYAITVHKSQGSEFNEVALLLPQNFNSVLTNGLLYTGVTRSKNKLNLFANEDILRQTLSNHSNRISGLATLL